MRNAILEGVATVRDFGRGALSHVADTLIHTKNDPAAQAYWQKVYCYLRGYYDAMENPRD